MLWLQVQVPPERQHAGAVGSADIPRKRPPGHPLPVPLPLPRGIQSPRPVAALCGCLTLWVPVRHSPPVITGCRP